MKKFNQLRGRINQHVRRSRLQGVGSESVGYTAAPDAGIAGGEHVNIRIADDDGFFRRAAAFTAQSVYAQRVGLLGGEAVSAVDLKEEITQSERLHDLPRRVHGLVAKHGEPARRSVIEGCELLQSGQNPVIDQSVIQLVLAVVKQKVLQRAHEERLVVRVAQGAAHQRRSAVADVAGDDVEGEFGASEVPQHGIDGVGQVEARIHQGAIEIENEKPQLLARNWAVENDHSIICITARLLALSH